MTPSDQETVRLQPTPLPAGGRLRLLVIGDGAHATHALPEKGTLVIGRADEADVRLDDRAASRRHAVLHVDGGARIEDLGSANGTKVRDTRLSAGQTVAVVEGDVIEVGSTTLLLQRIAAPVGAWDLLPHDRFVARLTEELAAGAPLSLLRFQVLGGIGAAAIQQALAGLLGERDRVATWGPGEYEVLAPGLEPASAEALASRVASRLTAAGAFVRSAVASSPRDGSSPESLLAAASAVKGAAGAAFVVQDDALRRLYKLVDRIAPSSINVLLLGETGVGKEVLAAEVHKKSRRAAGPFLRLNCAALSETLLESELFGHEKGAFTGAVRSKPGLLETAAGGTVLLDEVGELPAAIQAKLLRVLEERQVMPVGGLKPQPIDVRFVFATNRDLEAEVARGAFREDLYYRLNGIALVIPPLRERPSELEPLARDFAAKAAQREGLPPASFGVEALAALRAYPWPGNIRELRNVIERAVLLAAGGTIAPEHLALGAPRVAERPGPSAASAPAAEPANEAGKSGLREERDAAERRAILEALEACGGNQTRAAQKLGISRRTLVARLQQYGLTKPRRPKGA